MGKSINFTKAAINEISPENKRVIVNDTSNRFLKLIVQPSGLKSFYYVRRLKGITEKHKLGDFPHLSVSLAREEANKMSLQIALGHNPMQEIKTNKKICTINDLFEIYLIEHAINKVDEGRQDKSLFEKYASKKFKRKTINDVTKDDIRAILREVRKTKVLSNRVLALLSKLFNFAIDIDMLDSNPCNGINKYPETPRKRHLSKEALPKLLKALDEETNQTWKDFFYLLLWTGARKNEIQKMKWNSILLDESRWSTMTKNGDAQNKYRPAPAIEILSRRKEEPRMISESKQDYVFPAESASGHIQEPKRAWAKLIERAKITDFRMHDLRHTFAVWQISEGASLYTVGKSLGHKSMQSTEVYADIEMSAIKKSIDRSVEAMLNVKNA